MRALGVLMAVSVSVSILAASGLARAEDGPKPARGEPRAKATATAAERERAALAFVRENHPELGTLLEQLKPMRPAEYNRAIADLYQVSRSLAETKQRNPRRYELALQAWKARSKAELVAARLVSAPSAELESQMRTAVEDQFEAELKLQELDRDQVEARLKKLDESIKRLKRDRNKLLDSRFQVLRKKARRARGLDAEKATPVKPTPARGERKA